jgi:hypothetical protein
MSDQQIIVAPSGEALVDLVARRDPVVMSEGICAKRAGCIHHRFGVGDGFVVIVDEWESAEQFQRFFSDPELQAFIASTGAIAETPPELSVTEAITSPDQF